MSIRIKIDVKIQGREPITILLKDFPVVLKENDAVNIHNMVHKNDFENEDDFESILDEEILIIEGTIWRKDKEGYFLQCYTK